MECESAHPFVISALPHEEERSLSRIMAGVAEAVSDSHSLAALLCNDMQSGKQEAELFWFPEWSCRERGCSVL